MLLTHSLLVMTCIFFCFGCVSTMIIEIGYVYLMELMPAKNQPHVTTIWSVQESLIYITCVVWFWKISKHWFGYALIGYAWNLISVVCMYWVPESPRYLIAAEKMKEAKDALEIIAKWNKKTLEWDESKYIESKSSSA